MTKDIRTTIASKIIQLRKQNGITQCELAERSGVSRRTIQSIESEEIHTRVDILDKLVESLDHTIEIIPKKKSRGTSKKT